MFFFFNDSATTEFYTLSLHDALPISGSSHRLRLDRVGYLHAEAGAVAELLLDLEGLVGERERDVGYSGAAERVNLGKQERSGADRDDGLRGVDGGRARSRPPAPCEPEALRTIRA